MNPRVILATTALTLAAGTAAAGPLLDKADAYEAWTRAHHFPGYGSHAVVLFDSPAHENPVAYRGIGDSTIWTGTYLGSQALRYAVTGDPEAKANAISAANALHVHLRATLDTDPSEVAPERVGKPFIARYVGPAEPPFLNDPGACAADENCHVIDQGPYAGSFWKGNTSRDQYTGWWFGYALAHELVDDEPMRQMIERDVLAVSDQLWEDDWVIKDVDGIATTAGPHVGSAMQLDWLAIRAAITGDPDDLAAYQKRARNQMFLLRLTTFHMPNVYMEYYAFNLSHETFYNLIRLEADPDRRAEMLQIFNDQVHRYVADTHNVFFDFIWMALNGSADPATLADDRTTLASFPGPPKTEIPVELEDWPIDPVSEFLHDANVFLSNLIPAIPLKFSPQTLDPRPIEQRCRENFIWQRKPYPIVCHGGDGSEVGNGVDYLVAYWMGRYHGFLDASD